MKEEEVSDKQWVEALKQGRQDAFVHFYAQHHTPLYAFALTDLKIPSLAEDAVQEVFIKLWVHRRKLDTQYSIKAFLFTCLKNQVLNMIRAHKNRIVRHLAYQQQTPSFSNETEKTVAWAEYQQWILRGISRLSDRRKQVMQLSLFKGLTPEEIAGELDLAPDTVKTHLKRSNKFLKTFIKENLQL